MGYQQPDFWNEVDRLIESGRTSLELKKNKIGDGKRKPGKWVLDSKTGKLVKVDK